MISSDTFRGRFSLRGYCAPLLLAALVAGCAAPQTRMPAVESASAQAEAAKQRELVVEDWLDAYRRLQTVAARVVVSGRELCGEDVAPYYGLTAWNSDHFKGEWRDAVAARYALGSEVQLSLVVPGSAAETAGLREGDVVLAVNGAPLPAGKGAPGKLMEKLAEAGKSGLPVELRVRRGGEESALSVMPEPACNFRVALAQDDTRNAYADGKQVVIHKGMMDFMKSDEEVALVVSHELAHNAMKHIDAKTTNAIVGGLVGLLLDVAAAYGGVNTGGDFARLGSNVGAAAHSVPFEQEADYVGLYFMANAGYRIDDAANFWRRMAVADPRAITMKSTHPTSPERFVAIESAVAEIQRKLADGAPLKPELKPK